MPPTTRSGARTRTNTKTTVYVLIDKTVRNRDRDKSSDEPKKKPVKKAATKGKGKRSAREPAPQRDQATAAAEPPAHDPVTPAQDRPAFDLIGPSRTFETPHRPKRRTPPTTPAAEPAVFNDPPPAFGAQTPTPNEARARRRSGAHARIPSPLPPSSPIPDSSPATPNRHSPPHGTGFTIYYGTAGTRSQIRERKEFSYDSRSFQTPTRKRREGRRLTANQEAVPLPVLEDLPGEATGTPLWRRPSVEEDNDELFAEGIVDEEDEKAEKESIGWENAGSDKENNLASASVPRDEPNPFDPVTRGILQPLGPSSSPRGARSEDDPFGILEAERRLRERRAQAAQQEPEQPLAGPSTIPMTAHRRPFGRRSFADLNPTTPPSLPFPSSPAHPALGSRLPDSSPEVPRYSDSDIEDLYATPPVELLPLTPRKRKSVGEDQTTPVMTPRHEDNGREVTMRKRRRKGVDMSIEDFAERGSSAVTTPSPVKRTGAWDVSQEEASEVAVSESPAKRLRGKGKGKENAVSTAAGQSKAAVAREDESTPRKRPRREVSGRVKPAVDDDSEGEVEEEIRGKGKAKATRGRGSTRGVGRGRGRGRRRGGGQSRSAEARRRKKKENESTPDEIREKREHDRQERIEYFKKLEGYKLPKENVYVI